MIRFIDLTGQINDGSPEFAFYDTVTDIFAEFSGNQTWESVESFKEDYTGDQVDRYLRLIPDHI